MQIAARTETTTLQFAQLIELGKHSHTNLTDAKSNYTCKLIQGKIENIRKMHKEKQEMPQQVQDEQDVILELVDPLKANLTRLADGLRFS